MSRFYVPPQSIRDNKIFIDGPEAHHIIDVMRLGPGDEVVVFDGTGNEYDGVIEEASRSSAIVLIRSTRPPDPADKVRISLIQAIPKGDKIDYISEKATELGAHEIIPVITDRTIIRWDESKRRHHTDRLRKIVEAASKQCGRSDIPSLLPVTNFTEAVDAVSKYDIKLIAALSRDAISIKDVLKNFKGKNLVVAIGPEGDFTPREIEHALQCGFKLISLGRRVLRADTAGLNVMSILGYELDQ